MSGLRAGRENEIRVDGWTEGGLWHVRASALRSDVIASAGSGDASDARNMNALDNFDNAPHMINHPAGETEIVPAWLMGFNNGWEVGDASDTSPWSAFLLPHWWHLDHFPSIDELPGESALELRPAGAEGVSANAAAPESPDEAPHMINHPAGETELLPAWLLNLNYGLAMGDNEDSSPWSPFLLPHWWQPAPIPRIYELPGEFGLEPGPTGTTADGAPAMINQPAGETEIFSFEQFGSRAMSGVEPVVLKDFQLSNLASMVADRLYEKAQFAAGQRQDGGDMHSLLSQMMQRPGDAARNDETGAADQSFMAFPAAGFHSDFIYAPRVAQDDLMLDSKSPDLALIDMLISGPMGRTQLSWLDTGFGDAGGFGASDSDLGSDGFGSTQVTTHDDIWLL